MTLQELGQELRRRREEQSLSIDDLANRLKISGRTLRAIEGGSLDGLPHSVYAKGFIRSCGLALRVEPAELNGWLEEVFPASMYDEKPEAPLYRVEQAPGAARRVAAVALRLLLVGGIIGGGWYLTAEHGALSLNWVKQLFSAGNGGTNATGGAAASARNPSVAARPEAAPASGAASRQMPADNRPADVAPSAGASDSVSGGNATAASSEAESPVPAVNEIQITATSKCWVGYRADGAQEVGYTVRAGESYSITWKDKITVRLGNPSVASVTVNGKDFTFPYSSSRVGEFSLP